MPWEEMPRPSRSAAWNSVPKSKKQVGLEVQGREFSEKSEQSAILVPCVAILSVFRHAKLSSADLLFVTTAQDLFPLSHSFFCGFYQVDDLVDVAILHVGSVFITALSESDCRVRAAIGGVSDFFSVDASSGFAWTVCWELFWSASRTRICAAGSLCFVLVSCSINDLFVFGSSVCWHCSSSYFVWLCKSVESSDYLAVGFLIHLHRRCSAVSCRSCHCIV